MAQQVILKIPFISKNHYGALTLKKIRALKIGRLFDYTIHGYS